MAPRKLNDILAQEKRRMQHLSTVHNSNIDECDNVVQTFQQNMLMNDLSVLEVFCVIECFCLIFILYRFRHRHNH
jgi:hypothetical protein